MDPRPPRNRYRSSTSASTPPNNETLADPLDLVLQRLIKYDDFGSSSIRAINDTLIQLGKLIDETTTPNASQDHFRRAHGFQALLDVLHSVANEAKNGPVDQLHIDLCREILQDLSKMLKDHHGNCRYFAKRVHADGWGSLQRALQILFKHLPNEDLEKIDGSRWLDIIDALISLATATKVHWETGSATTLDQGSSESATSNANEDSIGTELMPEEAKDIPGSGRLHQLRVAAKNAIGDKPRICHGEALGILANLYGTIGARSITSPGELSAPLVSLVFIETLANSSRRNLITMHGAGILSALLPHLTLQNKGAQEMSVLRGLCESFLALGINHLEEAAGLFRQAVDNDSAKEMLLAALRKSKRPSTVQFDLSENGYCSLELPALPRAFPPISGYSFTAWIRVDQFDPRSHTTLFGAFDSSQTCFVLIYIEKDTRQLILQTSVTSPRPSVRFKKMRFRAGDWCHVALVHYPPKSSQISRAALYIDGRFVEDLHCPYPDAPPTFPEFRENNTSTPSGTSRRRPVQAFFGTPQDLTSQPQGQKSHSCWSLANAHLHDTCLSLDIIAVHETIGPRYSGNYQDCIGAFLTYRASAELNRYNEALYRDKCDKSEIVQLTQQHGYDVLSESKLLISVSASAVADMNGLVGKSWNMMDILSDKSSHYFRSLTRSGNSILFNAARPDINDNITRPHGIAVLAGNPITFCSNPLDDASWQIGGCLPVNMKILQNATSDDAVVTAMELLLECVRDNWRTSEAMEKNDGFGVVAMILREKLGLGGLTSYTLSAKNLARSSSSRKDALAMRLLRIILDFVGYNFERPEKSLLINPMAYRILLVDFDTWRTISAGCQKLYFRQIADFVWKNNNQAFNMKRFNRNRIVRRILDALKMDHVTSDVLPEILQALRAICLCRSAHLNHRDIATFITYALHDERALQSSAHTNSRSARSGSIRTPHRRSSPEHPDMGEERLTKAEIGISVLKMYAAALSAWDSNSLIRRFDHSVPTKWILQLISEPHPHAVAAALTIISRTLIEIPTFKTKFTEKNSGFLILQSRLRSQWSSPQVWMGCFSILFGKPFCSEEQINELTLFHLMEAFAQHEEPQIRSPEIFPAIAGMLDAALRNLVSDRDRRAEDNSETNNVPKTVIQFLADVHARSKPFRDFATTPAYTQELLFVLFPIIASVDRLNAAAELASEGPLNFNGRDVVLRPHSNSVGERPTVLRSGSSRTLPEKALKRVQAPRRTSSFVFVNAGEVVPPLAPARFNAVMSPNKKADMDVQVGNDMAESLLELVTTIFIDQICQRKDFSGFGLFLKVPPGFQEHQAYFESYVLLHISHQLWHHLQLNQKLLIEPRVLTNLAKYSLHMAEAVFEGWFIDGAQPLLDFTGRILDYLQQPSIAATKAVRLCNQAVSTMRSVFLRVTLLRLSELDETEDDSESLAFVSKMTYWQTILFSPENQELPFIRLICYLLYIKLVSPSRPVRFAAASLWRMLLVQKPAEAATILIQNSESSQRHLSTGLIKLAAHDDEELLQWIDQHRGALDNFFTQTLAIKWEEFVNSENQKTEETAMSRLAKRKEKLKQWQLHEAELDNVLHQFENSKRHAWSNVHAQERLKYQGIIQDQQENLTHVQTVIAKLENQLHSPCGLFPDQGPRKWQLDQTEARNRMRMRIVPDMQRTHEAFQSKRKASQRVLTNKLQVNVSSPHTDDAASPTMTTTPARLVDEPGNTNQRARSESTSMSASGLLDGEFELVDDPNDDEEGYEDKNRKVLKSLRRGDRVQNLCNVSRIHGLEAFEGLMIIGKKCLYLQDALFQRSDGEIVSVSQAPLEERDPYVQMISGKDIESFRSLQRHEREPSRHWTWQELLSVSKRRFLFRDVALEVFFTDGRSYLLTFMTPKIRDDIYTYLVKKAPHIHGDISTLPPEDTWRLDTLRNPEEAPQSLGSKLSNVFNSTHNAATRRWLRGEISNFQYLMLVNTMAGRTFNDLTQYPVFPWVLADYTSEEIDLTDPRSFRDLSKPMGCQNPSRESDFRERYRQFAEMGDENAQPFHYGTHYSTAMIVSSYLIRLPPFVQSYLALQGGSFDHADRLFDSIERAWMSASKENMTDVRELTPEFFYLPEFLTNINGYEFGQKQGSDESVNDVVLPPWAKGDPHIFIAKHREALESPYVSQHLQEWIDLIFGYKQRGEAALEATNVFHPLSYQGAKDLDAIEDSFEKLATISIIHNFGQTPHQIFSRAHPRKGDDEKLRMAHLDTIAESLVKIPFPLHENQERVVALTYAASQEKLLCSPPCRFSLPPTYKAYVQWGYSDNSIRFFSTSDSRKMLGLYEGTHIGPISTVLFADSRTMITGGADSVIGVWNIRTPNSDVIDMTNRTYLFGHQAPISLLAMSRAFSTLVSASTDGHVLLWDLNRFDCVRVLQAPAKSNTRQSLEDTTTDATAPSPQITACRISNLTGQIALCANRTVRILTLNGHQLLSQQICDPDTDDEILCCAFYEGKGNEWVERTLLFTGHKRGVVNIFSLVTLGDGSWHLQLVKRLIGFESPVGGGGGGMGNSEAGVGSAGIGVGPVPAGITCVLPMAQVVYTGDEEGKVFEWSCVQKESKGFGGWR